MHTYGKKMARNGRTKDIYKGTFICIQTLGGQCQRRGVCGQEKANFFNEFVNGPLPLDVWRFLKHFGAISENQAHVFFLSNWNGSVL